MNRTRRHTRPVTFNWYRRNVVAAAAALAASTLVAPAWAQGQSGKSGQEQAFAPGRILVMPRAGMPEHALERILKDNGAGKSRRVGNSDLRIVDLPPGLEKKSVEWLSRHPHIEFAEVDELVAPAAPSNDPYYGSAWHLPKVGAPTAWDASTGTGVTIAILDTGVDAAHPDLASRIVPGWNFYDNNSNTSDVHGHGTGVAGAAAATLNNGTGVASIAGNARIMPVRIADANAWATWSTVAQGLTWAADKGARVANISYNGVAGSAAVRSAAQYMQNKGGVVVVAAGNNNKDEGISPTTVLIPVSATDSADQKASFSSWGNFVAMSAPGVDIWTTVRGGSYQRWKGTSLASPVAAGTVALIMARNPALTGLQAQQVLFDTATDLGAAGRDPVFGHGRVNAAAAVAAAFQVAKVDATAPTVAIPAPVANSTVSGLVPVSITASDNVGVTRVELRVNGKTVATDTTSPFGFSWDSTQVANGMANLVAVAYDAAGNSAASTTVAVNVANTAAVAGDSTPPTVVIGNPRNGSKVSGSVKITVSASDDSGAAGIKQELYVGGVRVATAAGGQLTYTWNTRKASKGTYAIQAIARDAAGNASSSAVQVSL